MITKFTLTIDGIEHDLSDGGVSESIKNWADIICAYKRSDYNGIVRSFSSKFQFVNDAYDLLLELFLRDRYDAVAVLAVYTINDDRSWMKRFECELDFSTKSIADGVFSVGAIDNSLAALIKANKGTKYEMIVGTDIRTDGIFHFDRLPMSENVTYAITQGDSDEDSGAIMVQYNPPEDGSRTMWIGNVGDEIFVGGTILWSDDQEDNRDGYIVEAHKDVVVEVNSLIAIDVRNNGGTGMEIAVVHVNSGGTSLGRQTLAVVGGTRPNILGEYPTENDLNTAHPISNYISSEHNGKCAIVTSTNTVYFLQYIGYCCVWRNSGQTPDEYFRREQTKRCSFSMHVGDKLRIEGGSSHCSFKVMASNINFKWTALGDMYDIDAFTPKRVASALIDRMTDGKMNVSVQMSDYDNRLARTVILAAESLRGMPNARLYSTFTEFSDWMSTVFGYTYYLGDRHKSRFTQPMVEAGYSNGAPVQYNSTTWTGEVVTNRIVYCDSYGMFLYRAENQDYYLYWSGWQNYNHPGNGLARTDTLFKIGLSCYYFAINGSNVTKHIYDGNPETAHLDVQELHFVHRSELFRGNAQVKVIDSPKEVSNSTTSSQIFSTIEIGYDKKDYDQINGRDEWNFDNTYSTGCTVSEKKLTLKSKYRCDCYGIEFAAQKRGKETTDSDSDNDIFFVYCGIGRSSGYVADRASYPVEGALSDRVFNGAYSPMQCVLANAGYIGMQSASMTLKFTSSNGNSDIIVRGMAMSADISLDNPMMMTEAVEFTTDDDELPADINDLIQITDNGITYLGYINEVEMKFARENAIKYKLLIKDMSI